MGLVIFVTLPRNSFIPVVWLGKYRKCKGFREKMNGTEAELCCS